MLKIVNKYDVRENFDHVCLKEVVKFGILNVRRAIIIVIKTDNINDLAAQHMLFEILPAKLVVGDLHILTIKVLLSVSLAVVKVNLYRLLNDINIFIILFLEARDGCTVIRFAENIFVQLELDRSFQFGANSAADIFVDHGRFGSLQDLRFPSFFNRRIIAWKCIPFC